MTRHTIRALSHEPVVVTGIWGNQIAIKEKGIVIAFFFQAKFSTFLI
jgi:hypothetical protein